MSPAARAADAAIGLYQTHLSARKRWSCAHRVAHGGASCSSAVRTIVRERGIVRAVVPTTVRFVACHQAARMLMATEVQGVCCCGGIPIPFRF